MTKKTLLFLLAALMTTSFISCDKDDANWGIVPDSVRTAFEAKYPNAKRVEWENKGNYKVADFYQDNMETEAWFESDGTWYMTETDIPYNLLPQTIKTSFEESEYTTWRIDDVDKIEKNGSETIYIIEVEKNNLDIDLYYNGEGTLIKTI